MMHNSWIWRAEQRMPLDYKIFIQVDEIEPQVRRLVLPGEKVEVGK